MEMTFEESNVFKQYSDEPNGTVSNISRILDVKEEINHVFASMSIASFVLLSIFLLVHYRKKEKEFSALTPYTNGALFFCSLVTMVADLSMGSTQITKEKQEISEGKFYNSYTLCIILIIGILVNIVGSRVFFRTPCIRENSLCGTNHASIGILIWGITIPLALLEMLMASCMFRNGQYLFACAIISTIFQKIIQVTTFYFGIRHKVPVANKHGASLFLKVIAVYNFAMWLQSITDGNKTMQKNLQDILDGAATVGASVYAALTTDYRLLCFLLFAELAIEVDEWNEDPEQNKKLSRRTTNLVCNKIEFRIKASEYTGCGYVIGLVVLGTQFINALQYLTEKPLSPLVNLFGITAELLVIFQGSLLMFLGKQTPQKKRADGTSKSVDIMVGFMGVIGLAFWILKCSLIFILLPRIPEKSSTLRNKQYLVWINIKNAVRIIGLFFQLFFFCRITATFGCRKTIRNKKISYFLLPSLMLSQLSIFVNSAIDSYGYIVEKNVKHANLSRSMEVLYGMGEPLYLGFVLHVFFRFLIINNILQSMPSQKVVTPILFKRNPHQDEERKKEQEEKLLGSGSKFPTM